ncbi:type III-A CRISPR-associated RAMP protein Csm4 [Chloroflexia bacterium SDU3-3]|nr:type III-A CRISPR-associated RAMP protein Csm4 [Chloroflexia bacterium SDU3-3]
MPTLKTYLLSGPTNQLPLSPHFGITGIGLENARGTWPSDSLFAALVAQAALMGSQGIHFIDEMKGANPPLRHSSLFPRIGTMILLPRPMIKLPFDDKDKETINNIGKGFKKVRWLSPILFNAVCMQQELNAFNHITLQHGEVWISAEETAQLPKDWKVQDPNSKEQQATIRAKELWKQESIPHVAVDRSSSTSAYYETGRFSFADQCGLGLIISLRQEWEAFFEQLLDLLGNSGIGGRRSIGYGQFSWARGPLLTFPDFNGGRVVTLSRFLPQDNEIATIQDPNSSYQLSDIDGWALTHEGASFLRKPITMLSEGSVLAKRVRGQVVDVRISPEYPSHPVLRSGLALTVPVVPPTTNNRAGTTNSSQNNNTAGGASKSKEKKRGRR